MTDTREEKEGKGGKKKKQSFSSLRHSLRACQKREKGGRGRGRRKDLTAALSHVSAGTFTLRYQKRRWKRREKKGKEKKSGQYSTPFSICFSSSSAPQLQIPRNMRREGEGEKEKEGIILT